MLPKVAIAAAYSILCAIAASVDVQTQPVGEIEESLVNVVQTLGQSAKKLADSVNATSAEGAALTQVLTDLHSLRTITRHLKRRRAAEIQASRSEVERLRSALALAEGRSEALMAEKNQLRAFVDQGVTSMQNCTEELSLHAKRAELAAKSARVVTRLSTPNCSQTNATAPSCENAVAETETRLKASESLVAEVRAEATTCSQEKYQVTRERDELAKTLGGSKGRANASALSLEKQLAAAKVRISDAEEEKDDATETVDEIKATNANLQQTSDAAGALVSSLQRDLNASETDKVQLLDSMRALMHRDDKLQAMIARGEVGAAASSANEVGTAASLTTAFEDYRKVVASNLTTPHAKAAAKPSKPPNTFDEVGWMSRTNKIDTYLSHLVDEENQYNRAADAVPETKVVDSMPRPSGHPAERFEKIAERLRGGRRTLQKDARALLEE